jgi:formate dehydrogenase maturation protein FdhE
MGKRWTKQEDEILVKLIEKGKSPKDINLSLGRSQSAIHQRLFFLRKENKLKRVKRPYTEEEDNIILNYVTNPKNLNLQGLFSQLERSYNSVEYRIQLLKKKHPELKIRKFTATKISTEDLKQILTEEVAKSKHNLQQAFRNVADRTGLTKLTVESYWYGWGNNSKNIKQLNRKNMPALFYSSDSKGTSKNEKNTNVIQVSKGKYIFNMVTSWLNNKFKVKSTTKKNSK